MKTKIKSFLNSMGIKYSGVVPSPTGCGSAVVCLFPYYAGQDEGNISLYARGRDYHNVVRVYLQKLNTSIGQEGSIFADNNPYPEREMAVRAGLGFVGENGMLISQEYGSYVFIGGVIYEELDMEPDTSNNQRCVGCGTCKRACPSGALGQIFDAEKCLSNVTQQRGELTMDQQRLIRENGLAWGCDLCQRCCPHNKHAVRTPLAEFREDLIEKLTSDQLKPLSGRQFRDKYRVRAFAWRGKKVLQRNLQLLEDKTGFDK